MTSPELPECSVLDEHPAGPTLPAAKVEQDLSSVSKAAISMGARLASLVASSSSSPDATQILAQQQDETSALISKLQHQIVGRKETPEEGALLEQLQKLAQLQEQTRSQLVTAQSELKTVAAPLPALATPPTPVTSAASPAGSNAARVLENLTALGLLSPPSSAAASTTQPPMSSMNGPSFPAHRRFSQFPAPTAATALAMSRGLLGPVPGMPPRPRLPFGIERLRHLQQQRNMQLRLQQQMILQQQHRLQQARRSPKTAPTPAARSSPKPRPKTFSLASLSTRDADVVASLYEKQLQCNACGFRFSDQDKLASHLDWHFRMNRRERERHKKAISRMWFYSLEEWLNTSEGNEVQEQPAAPFFEPDENEADSETDMDEDSLYCVPANEEQTACLVCGEAFEQFWDSEVEDWMYKGTLLIDDKIYHKRCYDDMLEQENQTQVNVDVASSPSEDFNGSSTIEVDQSKSTVDETQCSAQQTQDDVRSNAAGDRNNKAAVPSSAAAVVKSEDYTSIKRSAEVESDARVVKKIKTEVLNE